VKVFGPLARLARFADLDDQVEACRRVFASDTRWTVVRGSDLEEGESQGLPVWSRHVGDPILESNITRRVDFALFMVEALENDELVHEAPGDRRLPDALRTRARRQRSAILRGIEEHSIGDSAEQAIALRTARLILTPLSPLDEAEHARASGNSDDALRDTRAAELQWREHGFGPWAIRDVGNNSFLGAAELRFAGDGIEGIAPNEVEAGWWVRENRRNQGIATEATRVAIGDLWSRGGVESVTAYIEEGENEPSRRLAASLGFTMRGQGRGRFGEPMTVYELLRAVWDRRGG
jgi:RimJ/RimL family protein N-acetyltransferase